LVLARIAERAMAAVNRRDFEVLFLSIDPEIEYYAARDQLPLDIDAVSQGHDGYEKVWRQMIDSFEDFRGEPQEGSLLIGYVKSSDEVTAHWIDTRHKGTG
jgi:pilus assembly protein TadC